MTYHSKSTFRARLRRIYLNHGRTQVRVVIMITADIGVLYIIKMIVGPGEKVSLSMGIKMRHEAGCSD